MTKGGVSSKTHTRQQLNDYANQHNPNNKAYKARMANEKVTKQMSKKSQKHEAIRRAKSFAKLERECGTFVPEDWMCYGNPYDFD